MNSTNQKVISAYDFSFFTELLEKALTEGRRVVPGTIVMTINSDTGNGSVQERYVAIVE